MTRDEFRQFVDDVDNVLGLEIKSQRIYDIWFKELGHIDLKVANMMIDLCYAEEERQRKSLALVKKYQSRATAIVGKEKKVEVYESEDCDICGKKGFITLADHEHLPYEKTLRCLCKNSKQYNFFPEITGQHMATMQKCKRAYGNRYYLPQHFIKLERKDLQKATQTAFKYVEGLEDKLRSKKLERV